MEDPTPYITYQVGNCPIVLSAVHGGNQKPPHLQPRDTTAKADSQTIELVDLVATNLEVHHGFIPNRITCHLHRQYLDLNRFQDRPNYDGTLAFRDTGLKATYDRYYQQLGDLIARAHAQFQQCVVLDFHGFGPAPGRLADIYFGTLNGSTLPLEHRILLAERLQNHGVVPYPRNGGTECGEFVGYAVLHQIALNAQCIQLEICSEIRSKPETGKQAAFVAAVVDFLRARIAVMPAQNLTSPN